MLIACFLFFVVAILTIVELNASRKRKKINQGIAFAIGKSKHNLDAQNYIESTILGTGSSALNIYDIYAAVDEHEEVLEVLEYRYNNVMGDANPLDWFNKIEDLKSTDENSIGNYIRNFTGQYGEFQAIEYFQNQGMKPELFTQRNHPNDDLRVFDGAGEYEDWSVKNFKGDSGGLNNFLKEVKEHPDSENYIINSELYDKLEETGTLDILQEEGNEIIDGGFSNEFATETAENAFDEISNAGDITDNIPIVALAFFGVKTVINVKDLIKKNQTGYETTINVAGDLVRIGVAGLGAAGGGKLGMLIGSIIQPGIGTLVGGGIGTLIGALAGAKLIRYFKEKIKWGKIIMAIETIGYKYENGEISIYEGVMIELYGIKEIEGKHKKEIDLKKNYKNQLNAFSKEKPKLPAILTHIHTKVLEKQIQIVKKASKSLYVEIDNLCRKAAKKMSKNQKQEETIRIRLIGEIIIENEDIFLKRNKLDPETMQLIREYKLQKSKAPNHPYKFNQDSKEIVKGIAIRELKNAEERTNLHVGLFNPIMIMLIILLSSAAFYYLFKFILSF